MGGGKTQGRGRGVPLQTWPTSLFSPFPPLRGAGGAGGWSGEKKIKNEGGWFGFTFFIHSPSSSSFSGLPSKK